MGGLATRNAGQIFLLPLSLRMTTTMSGGLESCPQFELLEVQMSKVDGFVKADREREAEPPNGAPI